MKILKFSFIIAAAMAIMSALPVSAQRQLPAGHNSQHSKLLASQDASTNPFKIENNSRLMREVKEREDLLDNEIFTTCWDSQSVNPYDNSVVIPERKDIDVSEYVAPIDGIVTSNYGYRARFRRQHKGIDLALQVGDTVRAAFSGKVRLTRYERAGYGHYVVVRHENGLETVYGHLSRTLVKPNQYVKAGEPIALGGNTGRSTGPHLHFETRYMGIAINPSEIIDFENKTVLRDVFSFNKNIHGVAPKATKTNAAKRNTTTASKKRATTSRKRTTSKKK